VPCRRTSAIANSQHTVRYFPGRVLAYAVMKQLLLLTFGAGFARMIERAGKVAKLSFKPHPHMLRHACCYALANRGHDMRALQAYLGHRNIQRPSVAIQGRKSLLLAWPLLVRAASMASSLTVLRATGRLQSV
jgi:integrase